MANKTDEFKQRVLDEVNDDPELGDRLTRSVRTIREAFYDLECEDRDLTNGEAINLLLDRARKWRWILERLESQVGSENDAQVLRIGAIIKGAHGVEEKWSTMTAEERFRDRDTIHVV
jgi:hypothetical protein